MPACSALELETSALWSAFIREAQLVDVLTTMLIFLDLLIGSAFKYFLESFEDTSVRAGTRTVPPGTQCGSPREKLATEQFSGVNFPVHFCRHLKRLVLDEFSLHRRVVAAAAQASAS